MMQDVPVPVRGDLYIATLLIATVHHMVQYFRIVYSSLKKYLDIWVLLRYPLWKKNNLFTPYFKKGLFLWKYT